MKLTKNQELYQQVVQEAWKNETFKKKLIASPTEAIEKLTGKKINIPDGRVLVVKDQTDQSKVFFNIPTQPNMDNIELSEEELEAVAGGATDIETFRFVCSPGPFDPTPPLL